jgi:hypothetical protein
MRTVNSYFTTGLSMLHPSGIISKIPDEKRSQKESGLPASNQQRWYLRRD